MIDRSTSLVFELIRAFIPSLLICEFQEIMIKTEGAMVMISIFPIVSLWNVVVAIATKVIIPFPSKAYVINPPPEACYR